MQKSATGTSLPAMKHLRIILAASDGLPALNRTAAEHVELR